MRRANEVEFGFENVQRHSRPPATQSPHLNDWTDGNSKPRATPHNMGKVTRITARAVPPPRPLKPMTLGQAVFRACLVWGVVLAALAAWVSWGPQ